MSTARRTGYNRIMKSMRERFPGADVCAESSVDTLLTDQQALESLRNGTSIYIRARDKAEGTVLAQSVVYAGDA